MMVGAADQKLANASGAVPKEMRFSTTLPGGWKGGGSWRGEGAEDQRVFILRRKMNLL